MRLSNDEIIEIKNEIQSLKDMIAQMEWFIEYDNELNSNNSIVFVRERMAQRRTLLTHKIGEYRKRIDFLNGLIDHYPERWNKKSSAEI